MGCVADAMLTSHLSKKLRSICKTGQAESIVQYGEERSESGIWIQDNVFLVYILLEFCHGIYLCKAGA